MVHLVEARVEKRSVHKSVGKIESDVINHKAKADLNYELECVSQILSFHQMGLKIWVAVGRVKDQ